MKKICFLIPLGLFFLFVQCSKETDLCEGIVCQNGGDCVNGECNCPVQWTGPDCSQEKPPVKMRVGKIKITKFPPTDTNGGGWDLLDGPDVYFVIIQNGTTLFDSDYVEDLTGNFEWPINFEFSDPTATYSIGVYDYDDGITPDDFMGGINFTPYRSGEKFPTSYTLDCGSCVVSFQLTGVEYFHF